jgi:hypothetical protein
MRLVLPGEGCWNTVSRTAIQETRWGAEEIGACRALLKINQLPLAAQMIADQIRKAGPHAYQKWLQNALGRLPGAEHEVLRAIHDLDTTLIILNYENSALRHLEAITSQHESRCLQLVKGNDQEKILPLHWYCDRSDTLILDVLPSADLLSGAVAVEKLVAGVSNVEVLLWTMAPGEIVDALKVWKKFGARTGRGEASSVIAALLEASTVIADEHRVDRIYKSSVLSPGRSDHDTARVHYEQARSLYQRVGDVLGEAKCITSLGDISLARGDHDTAWAHYEQSILSDQFDAMVRQQRALAHSIKEFEEELRELSAWGRRLSHLNFDGAGGVA